jgi:alpha-glucosidase
MVQAHRSGQPIIRPLVYHFAHDPRCRTESFDFLLGSHLLVASVLEAGARTRRVYLPAGTWWCDFYSGQWYQGGQEIEVEAPLERIPLFVADGGVIPMGRLMRFVGERPDDQREIYVFARSAATFTLTEDDGISIDYHNGGYTDLQVSVQQTGEELSATATILHGGYPLPYTAVDFIIATDHPGGVVGGTLRDGRWHVRYLL